MASKKPDYNKRMRTKENEKKRKQKINLVMKDFVVREIMDESGEVTEDTIIQISFEGILIHLSVPAAMKLSRDLAKLLNL